MIRWSIGEYEKIQNDILELLRLEVKPDEEIPEMDELIQRKQLMLDALAGTLAQKSRETRAEFRVPLSSLMAREREIQEQLSRRMNIVMDRVQQLLANRRTLSGYVQRSVRESRYMDRNA